MTIMLPSPIAREGVGWHGERTPRDEIRRGGVLYLATDLPHGLHYACLGGRLFQVTWSAAATLVIETPESFEALWASSGAAAEVAAALGEGLEFHDIWHPGITGLVERWAQAAGYNAVEIAAPAFVLPTEPSWCYGHPQVILLQGGSADMEELFRLPVFEAIGQNTMTT